MSDYDDRIVPLLDGCHLWVGALGSAGYGMISRGGKQLRAHRVIYARRHGVAPNVLHHTCGRRECVNPDHLRGFGTHAEHAEQHPEIIQAALAASLTARRARTTCAKGHPYTPENTYYAGTPTRRCRTCRRAWAKGSARV